MEGEGIGEGEFSPDTAEERMEMLRKVGGLGEHKSTDCREDNRAEREERWDWVKIIEKQRGQC